MKRFLLTLAAVALSVTVPLPATAGGSAPGVEIDWMHKAWLPTSVRGFYCRLSVEHYWQQLQAYNRLLERLGSLSNAGGDK